MKIKNITLFVKILLLFIIVDSPYLYFISKSYKKMIYNIQKSSMKLNLFSALSCYLLLGLAMYLFIVKKNALLKEAFLLGLIIYGVYETTSHALLSKWDPYMVIIDSVWGGLLFTIVYYLIKKIN